MRYITLVCAAGMSTSMLVKKMQDVAKDEGIDVHIIAMSANSFTTYKEPTEILLLGPQVSYMLPKMKGEYEPKGMKVSVINMMDYGTMNGAKVLHDALNM